MIIVLTILIGLPLLTVAWWVWADRRLRRLPRPRLARLLLALFAGGQLAIYAWMIGARMGNLPPVPAAALTATYVWHLIILPATILALLAGGTVTAVMAGLPGLTRRPRPITPTPPANTVEPATPAQAPQRATLSPTPAPTRRQFLSGALVAAPPLLAGGSWLRAVTQLDAFRIRHLDVRIPGLPTALHGATIAHVSDVHVGRFTHGRVLQEIITQTRDLNPDLVLFTGDLIDHSLDDLPAGTDLLAQLAPSGRVFACEGNHDLFESRADFERGVTDAGIPLLLNDAATVELRGHPVQLLGLRWGEPDAGRGAFIDRQMDATLSRRTPDAFSILLAHHPHAFDRAAAAGIPLTLAGHTHGGQLMLGGGIGAGAVLFKYCSGLYRRQRSALVVSNGVGNWFPLRINAPAEIIHLTLRA